MERTANDSQERKWIGRPSEAALRESALIGLLAVSLTLNGCFIWLMFRNPQSGADMGAPTGAMGKTSAPSKATAAVALPAAKSQGDSEPPSSSIYYIDFIHAPREYFEDFVKGVKLHRPQLLDIYAMHSAEYKMPLELALLLKHGASPEYKGDRNWTVRERVMSSGDRELIAALERHAPVQV